MEDAWAGVFAVVAVVAVLVGVAGVLFERSRVYGSDVLWLVGRVVTEQEADVCMRYLRRHRMHRVFGGLAGVAVGLVFGTRWDATAGLSIGGAGGPLGDVIFCGVAGVIFGALSAESFRLRLPRSGPVAASLALRPRLPLHRTVVGAWVLVVAGAGIAVAGLAWQGDAVGLQAVALGVVVQGMGTVTRRAIAHRRRPVLSERALEIDGRMRGFASASVARLQASMGWLVVFWALVSLPEDAGRWTVVFALASVGAFVLAIVYLRRAAPRPPKGWGVLPAPQTGAAA